MRPPSSIVHVSDWDDGTVFVATSSFPPLTVRPFVVLNLPFPLLHRNTHHVQHVETVYTISRRQRFPQRCRFHPSSCRSTNRPEGFANRCGTRSPQVADLLVSPPPPRWALKSCPDLMSVEILSIDGNEPAPSCRELDSTPPLCFAPKSSRSLRW